MGEAKRRKLAGTYPQPTATSISLPGDLQRDIAQSVRSVELRLLDEGTMQRIVGGLCAPRAIVGARLLQLLKLPAKIMLGGMIYRVGPDPVRDTVPFCGPDNQAVNITVNSFLGHYWVESADMVVDFSVGDWRTLDLPDYNLVGASALPPIEWHLTPPDFWWVPKEAVAQVPGERTPPFGKAYYVPWRGLWPTAAKQAIAEFERRLAATGTFSTHFERC